MQTNKQPWRSLISFLVTWSFLVLTVTGLVLYIVPQGRVAYWVHWSLAGMEKEQWGWVHMIFGGVFIVCGMLHLAFNWKPFMSFLAARAKGHFELKREVVIATAITLAIFGVSAANLPPASWIIDLNTRIKASWVTSPELEPPFGHAEEVSLAALSRRMDLDLDKAIAALQQQGMMVSGRGDSLERIARANGLTPMDVYAIIRVAEVAPSKAIEKLSAEDIEARFAGTGLGRKTLATLSDTVGIAPQTALQRLAAAGISATADDTAKSVADAHDLTPIELLQIMLGAGTPAQQ
jgi:hypothetical protein